MVVFAIAIFAAQRYASMVYAVRLSDCPSVTAGIVSKPLNTRIIQITPHDSPGTLVFWAEDVCEIQLGSPPTGALNAGELGKNWRLSTNDSLYIKNSTRSTHSFLIKVE